jgi:hypothetical protein
MFKKIFILVALLGLASCYSPKTHGNFITEHQDAWIDGYAIRVSEHEYADKGLAYCRANVKEDGSAKPVCFMAEFK